MIEYSSRAAGQVKILRQHFEERDRFEAIEAMIGALAEAEARIEGNPAGGLPAPRPYPALKRPGRAWVKAGRYWVAYRTNEPLMIVAVFFETADIPGRL